MNIILILRLDLIAMIRAIGWFDSAAQASIRHVFEFNFIYGYWHRQRHMRRRKHRFQ